MWPIGAQESKVHMYTKIVNVIWGGLVLVAACSSGDGDGNAAGQRDPNVTAGAETLPDSNGTASKTTAPTAKTCSAATSCAYYYCRCSDGAIVNSRLCTNGYCQAASAHCDSACAAFNHGTWSGVYGGGEDATTTPSGSGGAKSTPNTDPGKQDPIPPVTGGASSGSGGSSSSGGSTGRGGSSSSGFCTSAEDCAAWTCGCTDGAVLTVRDCYNNVCSTKDIACQSGCEDNGHGDWDPG